MVVGVRRRNRRRAAADQRVSPVTEAERYAAMGWPLCTGADLSRGIQGARELGRACSCDRVGCPAPGAHPASPAWQMQATVDITTIRQWWQASPSANVILVTGRVFDVLEVPAVPGASALAMMASDDVETGPVAMLGDDTMHFYVTTRGAPVDEDEWWSCGLDCSPEMAIPTGEVRWHCRDSFVLGPPSVYAGGQSVGWVRRPEGRPLPDALRLLEYLADAVEGRR
jgi:Bifunctional DNA primase/polymerase, N-terminal